MLEHRSLLEQCHVPLRSDKCIRDPLVHVDGIQHGRLSARDDGLLPGKVFRRRLDVPLTVDAVLEHLGHRLCGPWLLEVDL